MAEPGEPHARHIVDPVVRGLRRPHPGPRPQRVHVVGPHAGGAEDHQVGGGQAVGGEPADDRAVTVAEHSWFGQPVGDQPLGEPLQPPGARLGEPPGRGVDADADGGGVPGPGDDGGVRTGRLVQGPGHTGRGAVGGDLPVEGPRVVVGAGHHQRDPARGAQLPEDLGDLAASARIEGEDLPAGRGEQAVAGIVGGGQCEGVGAVAQLQGRPVEVADDGRMPHEKELTLTVAQPGEEGAHFGGGRALRIGQLTAQRPVRPPRRAAGRRPGQRLLRIPRNPARRPRHHAGGQCQRGHRPRVSAHRALPLCRRTDRRDREEGRKRTGEVASHRGANSDVLPG